MRTVYLAENLIDAHLAAHALQHVGIDAHVLGGDLTGGLGELPVLGTCRVVVDDADADLAIRELARRAGEGASPIEGAWMPAAGGND